MAPRPSLTGSGASSATPPCKTPGSSPGPCSPPPSPLGPPGASCSPCRWTGRHWRMESIRLWRPPATLIPFLVVPFIHDRGRPPDPERAVAEGQKGQGPDREAPLSGRLPRQAGPHCQEDRQDHPEFNPLGVRGGAPLQPGRPRGPQGQAAPEPGTEAQAHPGGTEEGAGGPAGPPPDRGLWTGPKLRDWVERELGKKLSLYPIYRLLHEMGFALRVPRPRHAKAEGEAQEAFKKPPRPGPGGEGEGAEGEASGL